MSITAENILCVVATGALCLLIIPIALVLFLIFMIAVVIRSVFN